MGEVRDGVPGDDRQAGGAGAAPSGGSGMWAWWLLGAGLLLLGLFAYTPLLSLILFSGASALTYKVVDVLIRLVLSAGPRQREDREP